MDLYVILRRDGWRAPEDLQAAAERSTAEGRQARRRALDSLLALSPENNGGR